MGQKRIAAVLLAVSAASAGAHQQPDVFAALGTTMAEGQNAIMASFTSGTIALLGDRTVFKSASPELRATIVEGAIAVARAYTETGDFATRYARFREWQRPQREELPQNGDEALAAQQKQLEEVMREAEKAAETLSPDAREKLAHNIEYTRRQLAELQADPEHRKTVDAAVKESAREAEAEYVRKAAEFEHEYPADPRRLIAARLRRFLELSATVDFSAELVEKDKRLRFVDPRFEAKPRDWKLLYRAGKPAVDAARRAAEEWLKALGA